MNSKKAKKLRQLVRHLVAKGGGSVETGYTQKSFTAFDKMPGGLGLEDTTYQTRHVTNTLDPECMRAIYQQMKKV